jgi:uncharacterized protein YhdP
LREVSAEIADLEQVDELLIVTGKAAGPTADFLRFIDASPVAERIDHFTEDMKAEGNGELDLKLVLPLRNLVNAKVGGSYRFDGNRLTVDNDLPPLTDVRGFSVDGGCQDSRGRQCPGQYRRGNQHCDPAAPVPASGLRSSCGQRKMDWQRARQEKERRS